MLWRLEDLFPVFHIISLEVFVMSVKTDAAALPKAGRKSSIHYVAVTAMLSAVAAALMFVEIPIPALIPSFVKMDVSDLPSLLGSFSLGPVAGVIIAFVKNILHIVIKGTSSGFVGELCNFGLNAVFAITAGLIYKAHKSRKGAIAGSLLGAAAMGLFSVPLNYFLVYPAYAAAFGGMDLIIQAYQIILPSVDGLLECLLIFNLPFTFVKGLLCALLCFLIYKPLSPILHGRKD